MLEWIAQGIAYCVQWHNSDVINCGLHLKPGTHFSTQRSAPQQITLARQCGQRKKPEVYALNILQIFLHLYVNANEACRTETNPNECQKMVRLAFTYLNVHPALRTYFSLKYQLQTDSVRLFTKCSSHKQMLFVVPQLHIRISISIISACLIWHSRTDVDAASCTAWTRFDRCQSIQVSIILLRAPCGQLFCSFCCLSSKQAYFILLRIKFCSVPRVSDQLCMCLMRTNSQ